MSEAVVQRDRVSPTRSGGMRHTCVWDSMGAGCGVPGWNLISSRSPPTAQVCGRSIGRLRRAAGDAIARQHLL